jgi:hypothetical protein
MQSENSSNPEQTLLLSGSSTSHKETHKQFYCAPSFHVRPTSGDFLDEYQKQIAQADKIIVEVIVPADTHDRWCRFFQLWGKWRELKKVYKELVVCLVNDYGYPSLEEICRKHEMRVAASSWENINISHKLALSLPNCKDYNLVVEELQ